MALKHKYDLEKAAAKNEPTTVEAENVMAYSIEEITRLMHNKENTDI
jgi:hypothetical protein